MFDDEPRSFYYRIQHLWHSSLIAIPIQQPLLSHRLWPLASIPAQHIAKTPILQRRTHARRTASSEDGFVAAALRSFSAFWLYVNQLLVLLLLGEYAKSWLT
jgi:hypothetical protein